MTEDDLKTAMTTHNEAINTAREERDNTIRRAAADGMRQVDIIKATGYSRETVRRILKAPTGKERE